MDEATIHAAENTPAGIVTLGDIQPGDVEAIVNYWHGAADLQFLGIDPLILGTPAETRRRYIRAIRTGDPDQSAMAFAIRMNGAFAGYTLLNRYTPEVNYSHWHITEPGLRRSGLSTVLYPHRIRVYFDVARLSRLTHQTRTRNAGVNRMLDKFVPVAETLFIERPDGVAGPGYFHLRYVHANDIPGFFKRAKSFT